MTTRRPISREAILQIVGALIAIAAISVGISSLRRTTPTTVLAPIADARVSIQELGEVLTCERTLPDAPIVPVGQTLPLPVGRVSSTQAVSCPRLFDGRVVEYVGEVIGDVLRRDGGAWVLMNDDAYALDAGPLPLQHGQFAGTNSGLTVWLPDALVELVEQPGNHDWRGTVLVVRGRLLRTDPADGGGLTIRARQGEVLAEAVRLPHPIHPGQAIAAGLAASAAVGLLLLDRMRHGKR